MRSRRGIAGNSGSDAASKNTGPLKTVSDEEALVRLGKNLNDSDALILLYDRHRQSIEEAIFCQLGQTPLFDRAICSVLAHIAQSAHSFDPGVRSAQEWILRAASREARRLKRLIERRFVRHGVLELRGTEETG